MINKVHLQGNILSAKNGAVKMKISHGWGGGEAMDKMKVSHRQGGGEATDKELISKHKKCLKPIN